jgi:hypothetical protein
METAEKRAAKTEGNSEPAYSFSGVVGGWHALILSAQGLSRPRSLKLTAPPCYPCDIRDWRRIHMALYMVSYDVSTENQDYGPLTAQIEALGGTKILFSQWVVPTQDKGKAKEIGDILFRHIMPGDTLLVQEVANDASWIKLRVPNDVMVKLLMHCRC